MSFRALLLLTCAAATPLAAQARARPRPRPRPAPAAAAADTGPALPRAVRQRVESWYRTAVRRAPGAWGVAIADERGRLLWQRNADRPMIPASTVKVFTTSFAMARLGGGFTRATRVVGVGDLDTTSGQWVGTWQLQLNGDPTLEDPHGMGPRLYDLAAQLAAQGIRVLAGPMLLATDEATTADARFPAVWRTANLGSIYAPLIGPVTVHENIVQVWVMPGRRVGARPRVSQVEPFGIDALIVNEAVTRNSRRSRLRLTPLRDGRMALRGYIGNRAGMRQVKASAGDPRRVLEAAWEHVLAQAGIRWERESPAMVPPASGARELVLAEVSSPSLDSVAAMVNRRSLNIGAELLLRWAAGWGAPAESLQAHVARVVGTDRGLHLVDGSGLSHDDRATPRLMVSYLARVPQERGAESFPFLLPANGAGTLARLAGGLPAPGVVRAKTGTLSGVSTLTGYLGRREGTYVVSLMYNGGRTRRARAAQWQFFRVLGGDGVVIPPDTDFGPEVVADTLETAADSAAATDPATAAPVPLPADTTGPAADTVAPPPVGDQVR